MASRVYRDVTEQQVLDIGRGARAVGSTSADDREMRLKMGRAIRSRRRALNMTQAELAAQMDVSAGLISQWELGTSRILADDLRRLSQVLDAVNILFGGNSTSHPPPENEATEEDERVSSQRLMLNTIFDSMNDKARERLIRVALAMRD